MRTRNTFTLLAVVALGGGTMAFGQETDEQKAKRAEQEAQFETYFKSKDINGDGKLTVEESTAGVEGPRAEYAKKFFTAMDANKDSGVTIAEAKEFMTKMRTTMEEADKKFAELDTNVDSKVSLSEATAGKTAEETTKVNAIFPKFDADNDGFITKDESRRAIFLILSGDLKIE